MAGAANDRRVSGHLQGPVAIGHIDSLAVVGHHRHALVTGRQARRDNSAGDDFEVEFTEDRRRQVLAVRRHDDINLLPPWAKAVYWPPGIDAIIHSLRSCRRIVANHLSTNSMPTKHGLRVTSMLFCSNLNRLCCDFVDVYLEH